MEKLIYPLIYFELSPNTVLGILVGTSYQAVERDLKTLKSSISNYIKKQYRKHDEYPYAEIITPKLKIIDIEIRPTYKENRGSYPMPTTIKVPVITIFGEVSTNLYACFLPMLGESFYYYHPNEYQSLVNYFSTNALNRLSPEELYDHLLYPTPKLDTITLRVKENRDYDYNWNYQRQYKILNRLAEKYPYSKAMQRNTSTFPDAAWEMEDKVSDVVDKLLNQRANLLIVGNSGVGKSAILKQAIKKIAYRSKKEKLDFTFWRIMAQRITATSKYLGEWEETVEELVNELESANGILWVIDIVRLVMMGGEGPEDSVAAFLSSFIHRGKLQMVGEVTPEQLDSIRRLLPGFVEQFQVVMVEELPEVKVQSILNKIAEYSTQNLKIEITKPALELSYRLLLRYYPYQSFPGKALKFLSQCVNEAELNSANKIDKQEVTQNFIKQTGLPELFLRDDLLLDKEELTQFFNQRIIGQPTAVQQMCDIVTIFKAGLNNPYKPIATMIFAGPTGVGKTASAKALADYFFGKGQTSSPLIRIDMSEFQSPSQITRFIGQGKEVGKLVQDIREKPFAVLLLDEVEKAAPGIFDTLMTVFDEGKQLDGFGRVTNFRNCIIIMTSNLGASNQGSIGFGKSEDSSKVYASAISKFFRPEFVNRIDHVVIFNTLNKENIQKITHKELNDLRKREGFVKRGLALEFSNALIDLLSDKGFDERYGARPLQRTIENTIVAPLARWLLNNEVTNKTLKLDIDEGEKLVVRF